MKKTNRLEYYVRAVYYSLCLLDWNFGVFISKSTNRFMSFLLYILTTKAFRNRHHEYLKRMRDTSEQMLRVPSYSCDYYTKRWLYFYPMSITLFALGLIDKNILFMPLWLRFVLLFIPSLALYIPIDNFFDNDKRNKRYIKKFKKKDKQWHTKWKAITIFLCLGAIPFMILSMILGFWLGALL